uniref:Uncharacterized protein n=1 Tax=Fagus sylvatica TaxID=28930 RepID=A0A2N9FB42_FAGSY
MEDDSKSSARTAEVAPTTEKKVTRLESSRAVKARSSIDPPKTNALVITLRIGEFDIKRILIDLNNSAEITYEPLFRGLGLRVKDLNRAERSFYGFSGETVVPSGKVAINVKADTISSPTEFFVLNAYYLYNAILGRPKLHQMGAVPSTLHHKEIVGDQLVSTPAENLLLP